MKRFYALIASVLAILAGATSCSAAPPIYGINESDYASDNDFENIQIDEDLEQVEINDDVRNADADFN